MSVCKKTCKSSESSKFADRQQQKKGPFGTIEYKHEQQRKRI